MKHKRELARKKREERKGATGEKQAKEDEEQEKNRGERCGELGVEKETRAKRRDEKMAKRREKRTQSSSFVCLLVVDASEWPATKWLRRSRARERSKQSEK